MTQLDELELDKGEDAVYCDEDSMAKMENLPLVSFAVAMGLTTVPPTSYFGPVSAFRK